MNNIMQELRRKNDFIKWVFDSVKNDINLTPDELDANNDGKIDIVTFLCSGSTTKIICYGLMQQIFHGDASLNGKRLSSYNIINVGIPENNIFNKNILKVVVHEFTCI